MDLPFEIPHLPGELVELSPDVAPTLDGHERLVSYLIGEPWSPPPGVEGADVVTVTVRQRYEQGRLVPALYEVTYWRPVQNGG